MHSTYAISTHDQLYYKKLITLDNNNLLFVNRLSSAASTLAVSTPDTHECFFYCLLSLSFAGASLGDIALTESDYNLRLLQTVSFVEKLDNVSFSVQLNNSLSTVQKLNELEKLRKLKHRITKGNDDIREVLHKRRRERRKHK